MAYGSNALQVKQGDVILIRFPFSDLTGTKVRPALVISNDVYNSTNLDTVVLAISSNTSPHLYKISLEGKDLKNGNLPLKSVIRVDRPFSVLQSKILKIQGQVKSKKLEEVKLTMQKLFN